jgi:hypothetical protein
VSAQTAGSGPDTHNPAADFEAGLAALKSMGVLRGDGAEVLRDMLRGFMSANRDAEQTRVSDRAERWRAYSKDASVANAVRNRVQNDQETTSGGTSVASLLKGRGGATRV